MHPCVEGLGEPDPELGQRVGKNVRLGETSVRVLVSETGEVVAFSRHAHDDSGNRRDAEPRDGAE